jgi:hypothetical protein
MFFAPVRLVLKLLDQLENTVLVVLIALLVLIAPFWAARSLWPAGHRVLALIIVAIPVLLLAAVVTRRNQSP